MVKRYFLPSFTVALGVLIFLVFFAFSNGASQLQAYPPYSYPESTSELTGPVYDEFAQVNTTATPALLLPGMYRSSLGSLQKGLAWANTNKALSALDAIPFHITWYYNWGLAPPVSNTATVGAEFIPMQWCINHMPDPDNPTSYPGFLSKEYTGYLLFMNEPELDAQCGGNLTSTNKVISAAEVYSDVVAAFPNAKLIGPQLAYTTYGPSGEPTAFLEDWRDLVLDMELPLPHGYGIHLYPTPTHPWPDPNEWVQAYCDKLYEWGELDKELWVTEFGWSNDWVLGGTDEEKQAFMDQRVEDFFGLLKTGYTAGTPTPEAEPNCQITRYAWYTNRATDVVPTPTPTPTRDLTNTPTPGVGYLDLYFYYGLTRSFTGHTYTDFGNLQTPTPTPTP